MTSPVAPRSLAETLRSADDDRLAALLLARPDLLAPLPTDSGRLAARATARPSVVRALDRLDRFALQVVDALAVLEGRASAARLGDLLGVAEPRVVSALDRLSAQALVWDDGEALVLVRTVVEVLGPHPAGLGPPARALHQHLRPAALARLVAELGAAPAGDPVADAATVAGVLADGARLDRLLDEAGPAAREAAQALAAGPPMAHLDDARRAVTTDTARSPVERLLARGLLVAVESTTVVLPREVGLHLRGGRVHRAQPDPPEPAGPRHDATLVDRTAAAAALELLRLVESLLDAWSLTPPPVLRAGGLGVRDLRRTAATLDVDEPTAALLADLAHQAGLVAASVDVDEVWLPTIASDGWRREPAGQRWTRLAAAWLDGTRVTGLVGRRDDRDRPRAALGPDLDRPAAPELRAETLAALRSLPLGVAPSADGLLELVRWRQPRRGRWRDDLAGWTLTEAEAVGVTGRRALTTAGRHLLDGDLAAAGAALQDAAPPPLRSVVVQADLTAVAPGPLEPELARELALLADVESTGGATVYRFRPGSVRRGLDAGRSAEDVLAFLARVSSTPLPQPLRYLVEDVARRHGLLRVGAAASVLRCDDDALLTEILADRRSAPLGLRRLGATVLAGDAAPAELLAGLRELGYAPVGEGPDGRVVLATPEPRRAPSPPARSLAQAAAVPAPLLAAAVRAVRAGDSSAAARPGPPGARLPRPAGSGAAGGPIATLAALRAAVEAGTPVWIDYLDEHGAATERVVDPVQVEGGWLTGYDARTASVRSFAVHRIAGVAPVAPP